MESSSTEVGIMGLSPEMMSPLERRVEATQICESLIQVIYAGVVLLTGKNEVEFFLKMRDPFKLVSSSQLQWLRDLKEKYMGDVV